MAALEGLTAELRLRLSGADAHYGGGLVSGARGLEILGDVVTELAVRSDGDEGLFAGYSRIEFLAPLHAGDFVRARGRLVRVGRSSRTVELELWREIEARPDVGPSAADLLAEPVLATRATGTYVVRAGQQRGRGGTGAGR